MTESIKLIRALRRPKFTYSKIKLFRPPKNQDKHCIKTLFFKLFLLHFLNQISVLKRDHIWIVQNSF